MVMGMVMVMFSFTFSIEGDVQFARETLPSVAAVLPTCPKPKTWVPRPQVAPSAE